MRLCVLSWDQRIIFASNAEHAASSIFSVHGRDAISATGLWLEARWTVHMLKGVLAEGRLAWSNLARVHLEAPL